VKDYPNARHSGAPWVMEAPVISTTHVTEEDVDRLKEDRAVFLRDGNDTFVILIEDGPGEWFDYSESFQTAVEFFHNRGYSYLRFDETGDVIPQLKQP
jgi:hypothetical protein